MFRMLGFIVGAIVAMGGLVVLLGKPNLHFAPDAADAERYDVAIRQLKEKVAAPLTPTPAAAPPSNAAEVPTAASPEQAPPAEALPPPSTATESLDAYETEPLVAAASPKTAGISTAEPGWHTFWNPFRSEIAAAGFVRRLESITGLDYRVAKVKTGVYEVAFSYRNDSERADKLAQIAAATGLDLADTRP